MNGKSRAMIQQILQMKTQKCSNRKIAIALGISRNTVRRYLRLGSTSENIQENLPAKKIDNIDWDAVIKESLLGRPIKRIYEELQPAMGYSNFTRVLKIKWPKTPTVAVRLHHELGEKTQIDYADGLLLVDPRTGKTTKTQFYCGVLPASSFVFGEFTASQKLPDFIRSHERMWHYFGGQTKYVVLDNLKSGVSRAHRYDPEINPTYCDYANHSGFAALPARVRTPRDKACVEATIGVIQRDFFDRYRNEKFYSLEALNQCFRSFLNEFNDRVMTDYGCSRRERFKVELPTLQPLNLKPYELYEWKTAKVHPDSCIELNRSVYSVPFVNIHKIVQVKHSDRFVIILDESGTEVLATHPRVAKYQHSIDENHLPPSKTQLKTFDIQRVSRFAHSIGENTKKYVEWQFSSEIYPLRSLRRMQGLLRLQQRKQLSKESLEYAASQALCFQKKNLRFFEDCAKSHQKTGGKLRSVSPPKRELANIHLQNQE